MSLSVTPEQFIEARNKQHSLHKRVINSIKTVPIGIAILICAIFLIGLIERTPGPENRDLAPQATLFWIFIGLPLSAVLGFYLSILIHELGHIIAGRLNDFDNVFLVVGPAMLIKTQKGRRFQYSGLGGMQFAGFVFGVPKHDEALSRRLTFYYLGGPIATLLQVLFFLSLRWLLSGMTLSPAWHFWLTSLLSIGLILLLSSAVPMDIGGGFLTDAARIRQLQKKDTHAEFLISGFKLATQSVQGKRPRELDPHLIEQTIQYASKAHEKAAVYNYAYTQALDNADISTAARNLDYSLSFLLERPNVPTAPIMMLEAAYYEAFFNRDAVSARSWFKLAYKGYKKAEWLVTPQRLLRAEAAVLLAEGNHNAARLQAEDGLACLERHYDLGDIIAGREWLEAIICRAQEEPCIGVAAEAVKRHHPKKGIQPLLKTVFVSLSTMFVLICLTTILIVFVMSPNLRHQVIGDYHHVKGDEDKAIENYTKGIEADPDESAYNHLNRGEIFLEHGRYEEAMADFVEAIALRPDLYKPFMMQGITYFSLGDFESAIENFSRSLELEPHLRDIADLYFYRAAAYSYLDEYEKAAADYQQILAVTDDPEVRAEAERYLETVSD